jgi:hypothetical protein
MKNFITFFFFIFILAFPEYAFSQFEIKGKVLNSETNMPLEFATVFINNTTFGDITDREGNFTIQIPSGRHELVISFVGFQTFRYSFSTRILAENYTFKISPEIFDLEETQVSEKERNEVVEVSRNDLLFLTYNQPIFILYLNEFEEPNYRNVVDSRSLKSGYGNTLKIEITSADQRQVSRLKMQGKAVQIFENGSYFHPIDIYVEGYMA